MPDLEAMLRHVLDTEATLRREQLDQAVRESPGDGLRIHPGCHWGAPVEVAYQDGILFFRCYACGGALLEQIAVAE